MYRSVLSAATICLVALAGPETVRAQTVDDLAARFGARESIRSASLSPDGKQVVIVGPRPEGGENAVVVNLADGGKAVPILSSKGRTEQINHCQFVLETRVICELYLTEGTRQNIDAATRLVTLANDGSDMKLLSARDDSNAYYRSRFGGNIIDYNATGNPNAVLMTRYYPPENRTASLLSRSGFGLGVEQVDVVTAARKPVEQPADTAVEYYSDGHGSVRAMATQPTSEEGYAKRQINYSYRPVNGRWSPLSSEIIDGGISTGFSLAAVDSAQNIAYGFDSNGNFKGLFKRALDGSGSTSLLLGRPDADVDGLVQIGRNQRVVGASFATDRRQVEYFDPELKQLSASLAQSFGNDKQFAIIDASNDESRLLLYIGGDTDPGKYYFYDKATHRLSALLAVRPQLAGVKLGTMRSVQIPGADGAMIPAYLTLPPDSTGKGLPAIVMPHGGPSSRDEWGFDWLVQFFVSRGYAVLQPNYRGSSGLGAQWFEKNGFQSWPAAISDVNSAGRWLTTEGIAAPGKLAIFGWSYGGYAALQSAVVDPDLFKVIVAVAPVTDLDQLRGEAHDRKDFFVVDNFIGSGPHVESGSPARHAAAFKAPVLLFHGDADRNVGVGESRLMKSRLASAGKRVEYVEFGGLDHQLDDSVARARLLATSDRFIRQALGL